MNLAHAPIHFHSSDERFCGSRIKGRQFTFNTESVTCPVCRAKDAAEVMRKARKFFGLPAQAETV